MRGRFSVLRTVVILNLFFLCFSGGLTAQTGGSYRIESSSIASGGGRSSTSGYSLETTMGQPAAGGFLVGGEYSLYAGFLTPGLAPTAASVSVGGRVMTADGSGINNVAVTIQNSGGEIRNNITGSFGYYSFSDVVVGETCVITVMSKRFVFGNPTRVVSVVDEINDLDFVALPLP